MRLLVVLAAAALSACASQPGDPSSYRASAVEAAFAAPQPGYGAFHVKRDPSIAGRGCSHRITINRQLVAQLAPGETATFYAPPGEHILATTRDGGPICRSNVAETAAASEPGKRRVFRSSTDDNGTVFLTPTAH